VPKCENINISRNGGNIKSNKAKGTRFEHEFANILAEYGFWAHVLESKKNGAQPFDVIAVKNNIAYSFDCKVCESDVFLFSRIMENQHLAFSKLHDCGSTNTYLAVKFDSDIYIVPYVSRQSSTKQLSLDLIQQHCKDVYTWVQAL